MILQCEVEETQLANAELVAQLQLMKYPEAEGIYVITGRNATLYLRDGNGVRIATPEERRSYFEVL